MFAWLTKFRWRNRRQIFCYWDGKAYRFIDPMVAYRGLSDDPEYVMDRTPAQLQAAIDLGNSDNIPAEGKAQIERDALDLMRIMANACRRVFDVQPIDPKTGDGLTDSECVALLVAFGGYLSALKKNTSSPPTSPRSTESLASSVTSSSSDSSSTEPGNTTAEAQKSPSASGPLSETSSLPPTSNL